MLYVHLYMHLSHKYTVKLEIFMNTPYFNVCIFKKPSPLFDNAFEVAPFSSQTFDFSSGTATKIFFYGK